LDRAAGAFARAGVRQLAGRLAPSVRQLGHALDVANPAFRGMEIRLTRDPGRAPRA
jgi:hypothetical protein